MNIAYAIAGRPRPAGSRLLLRQGQAATSSPPTRRTSPRCSSCPACPRPTPPSRPRPCVAFETRLAKVSKSSEETVARRVAVLQPGDAGRSRQADAEFPVDDSSSQSQGVRGAGEVLAGDAGVPPGSEQDAGRRPGRHLEVLPALPHRRRSLAVPERGVRRTRTTTSTARRMRGQKEQKARWKRVLGAIESDAGEAFGQMYVKVAFPAESKARMEAAGAEPARRRSRRASRSSTG